MARRLQHGGTGGKGIAMLRQGFTALWWQARWARYAFLGGLLLGLLLGWFFHAVISLFLRLGLALALLLPIVIIAYLLWRRRTRPRPSMEPRPGSTDVITWNANWNPADRRDPFAEDERPEDIRRRWDE